MQVFFFGNLTSSTSTKVLAEVVKIVLGENTDVFQSLEGLNKRLRDLNAKPDIFVFVPKHHDDLVGLLSLQELLGTLPLILVLPDQRTSTIQYGHLLQPRFLTFSDSDLVAVGDVLQKIKDTQKSLTEEQMDMQQRSLWAILIKCPFFEGAHEKCPLNKHRKDMGLEEKFQFSIEQPASSIRSLLRLHQDCFQKRQERWMATVAESS